MRRRFHPEAKGEAYTRTDLLPEALLKQLASDDSKTCAKGIEALVERFISKRIERLRLTDIERSNLRNSLEVARKQGMKALKTTAPWLDHCPTCDGAFRAPDRLRRR